MTPRALLTAIRATALAFALAIGVAADSASVAGTQATHTAAVAVEPFAASIAGSTATDTRLAAWSDPCVIAV